MLTKGKLHYSWIVCIGCFILMFATVGLTVSSFGVYQPYVVEHGGLTNFQGSLLMTVRALAGLLTMSVVLKLHNKVGIRVGALLATLLSALTFVAFSMAHNFPTYCLAVAMAGMTNVFGGMVPVGIIIGRWFHRNRALAMGIATTGTGVATILASPVVTSLIDSVGLQNTFLLEAGFIAALSVVIFLLLRNKPEDLGLEIYGAEDSEDGQAVIKPEPKLPKHGHLYMMAGIFLLGASTDPCYSHLSMLFSTNGFNAATVSYILSFGGAVVTVGKLAYGRVTDKLGAYKSNYIVFSAVIMGVLLCAAAALSGSSPMAFVALLFYGVGLSLCTIGVSVFATDMSGTESYPRRMRTYQAMLGIGGVGFSFTPGIVADLTGGYVPIYFVGAAMMAVSMMLVQRTYRAVQSSSAEVSEKAALESELAE